MALRFRTGKNSSRRHRAMRKPASIQVLEDRALLAIFNLTSLADDGSAGTLRDAVTQSNATPEADTINIPAALHGTLTIGSNVVLFDPSGSLIKLNGTQLPTINGQVSIVGADPPPEAMLPGLQFAISGENLSRVFHVGATGVLSLENLVIRKGATTGRGGGILNQGALTLNHVTISDSSALSGGGIASESNSTLSVNHSTVSNNRAAESGGGVWSAAAFAGFNHDTIRNNSVVGPDNTTVRTNPGVSNDGGSASGGGLAIASGTVSIAYSSVSDNSVQGGNGGSGGSGTSWGPYTQSAAYGVDGRSGIAGGDGLGGGNGGEARGAGITIDHGALLVFYSTVANNTARGGAGGAGGAGGNGGDGQRGGDQDPNTIGHQLGISFSAGNGGVGGAGGNGGAGGQAGAALGGGVYAGDLVTSIAMANSTLASNQALGGTSGSSGPGGRGGRGGDGGIGEFSELAKQSLSGYGGIGGSGGNGGKTGVISAVEGGAVYFAASDNARHITGSTIAYNNVAGGVGSVSTGGGGTGGLAGISGIGQGFVAAKGADGTAGTPGSTFPAAGGGLSQNDETSGTGFFRLTLQNAIVGENTANSSTPSDIAGTLTSPGDSISNLIGTGGSGGIVNDIAGNKVGISNPGLQPLGNYGGETLTIAIDADSPAMNAGDSAVVQTAGLTTDQRGFPRISGGRVDIGAVEIRESFVVTTLADEDNGSTDPAAGTGTSFREAIALANSKTGLQTITLAAGLTGTIDLNSPLPALTGNTSIVGPGAGLLTIRRSSGGVYRILNVSASGNVKISGLTISNGNDGGILNAGILEVRNAVFRDNTTRPFSNGGAISNSGTLTVSGSTFSGNSSSGAYGGAIYNDQTLSLDNCTFVANSAGDFSFGGAVLSYAGSVTVNNSTFANNPCFTGDFYVSSGSVTLNNSILASSRTALYVSTQNGASVVGSHNLITSVSGNISALTGTISGDPKLGPLSDNGGPTPTMALLQGSRAINAGDNSVVPADLTTDQRGSGFSRILGETVDLGAFEAVADPPTMTYIRSSDTVAEGSVATAIGFYGDPQGRSTVTLAASHGSVTRDDSNGVWNWSYTPADDVPAPINVVITATDDTGLKTQTSFFVNVVNVAPAIRVSGNWTVEGGRTYALNLGAVSDPGTDTVSQYIVHWGDGTSDTYNSPGDKTHVYADSDALRYITVDLVDEDGSYLNTATFATTTASWRVGSGPFSVTKGDFNRDGRPDLATADGLSNTVSVLLNNGAGGFAPSVPYGVGALPLSITVGDFNGDGHADLATSNYLGSSVSVLLNYGNGTFAPAWEFASGNGPTTIAAGDFNSDGRDDLVTVSSGFGGYGPEIVNVIMSSGFGDFDSPVPCFAGSTPHSVAVGDFNKDGKPDIAVTNSESHDVSILLNTGNGSFDAAINTPAGAAPGEIVVGDFNGDSNPDLVVSDSIGGDVFVMLGNGTGAFSSTAVYASGGGSLTVGDFNNDGKQDVGFGGSAVSTLLNSGNGSFVPLSRLSVPNGALSMVAADFNGDGLQEFAVVRNVADEVSLLPLPALHVTRFTPTGLSVSSPTQDMTPTVTWTSVATAVSYDVYLKNQNTSQVIRQTVTGASWTPLADLGIGRFRFWVRSVNAAGAKSAWSLPTTFTVNTAVTVPAQTLGRTVRPNVTWMPLAGAVSYEVWLTDSSRKIAPLMRPSGVTSTSWTPSSDLALGTYTFWVRGVDAAGRVAAWSVPNAFNVQAAPTPTSLISSTFSRQPEFTWTAPVGSASFVLSLANHTTGATQTISGITGTSWTPPSNLADGRWVWRVRAVSQFGSLTYSSDSSQMNVGGRTVVSTPAANRAASAVFNWTAVSGAASYSLWLNRTDIAQAEIRKDGITTSSFTTSSPLAAGTYRIWVRAVSTTGEVSPWSRAVDFTVSSSANANGPSLNDEHLLVKWKLASQLVPLTQIAEDEFSSQDERITEGSLPDERANDVDCIVELAAADPMDAWHHAAHFEQVAIKKPVLSFESTWDLFGLLDETQLNELLHSL